LVREWSVEGEYERNQSFTPLINTLEDIYSNDFGKGTPEKPKLLKKDIQVLVPGCGLGRLPLEIVSK
jgi:carnosine N-methyltransferase